MSDADCVSLRCTSGACATPTCHDLAQNGGETDIDCGGPCVAKCRYNKRCLIDTDCLGGACDAMTLRCAATCTDQFQDGDETDQDCGGSCALKCAVMQHCMGDADCITNNCFQGHCFP
jgi:hypothetical protein